VSRVESVLVWLFGVATRLLPQSLRKHAAEMAEVFRSRLHDVRGRSGAGGAVAAAARDIGDVVITAVRLRARRASPREPVLFDVARDVRHALRSWLRQPAFAAVAIITLALGIGANTAFFTVVDAALLEPLPYPQPERLVLVWQTIPRLGMERAPISYPNWKDWRAQARSFADLAAFRSRVPHNVRFDAGVEQLAASLATGNMFSVVGVRPLLGRSFSEADTRADAPRVVVLSHALWQRSFGANRSVLGSTLAIDGEPHTIVGVMPAGFDFPSRFDELWLPLRDDPELERDLNFLQGVGRLAAGATVVSARAELTVIFDRMRAEYPDAFADHQPSLATRREQVSGDARPMLLLLSGAVAVLLLVTCANLANLMLIRATTRGRELAVRSALGAGRSRLLRQLLAEGGVLALCGGAAGVLIAFGATRVVLLLAPESLPRRDAIGVDTRALWFTLAVSLTSALLFALVPAWRASRAQLQTALRDSSRATASLRIGRLQHGLVVLQVALALVLLTSAGLLVNSFARLAARSPGFDARGVLTFRLAPPATTYPDVASREAFFADVLARVRALPNVLSVGGAWALPFGEGYASGKIVIEGMSVRAGDEPQAGMYAVRGDYFETLRIPLLSGRHLGPQDHADAPPVVVITKAMADRFWPGQEAVGKRFKTGDVDEIAEEEWTTVVGVVGNARRAALDGEDPVEMYFPYPQAQWARLTFLTIRTDGEPLDLLAHARAQVRAVDPQVPLTSVRSMEERVSSSIAHPRFRTFLLVSFAALAGALALVGIYGVMAFTVAQRAHEIGVRMALGAARRAVLSDVLTRGLRLVAIGLLLGLALAAAASRLLTGMLFEVRPLDPSTYAATALLLAAAALAACWAPAHRASRVDPMVTLRD
jgi:predicted permease